jgi:PAS domain S-box-containing protein
MLKRGRKVVTPLEEQPDDWPLPAAVLIESAFSGLVVFDEAGRIVLANRPAELLFGYERSELRLLAFSDLIVERLRPALAAALQRFRLRPHSQALNLGGIVYVRCKDARELPVEVGISPVGQAGRAYVMASVRDISARLALEAERERLKEELDRERERERIAMDLHDGIMQDIYAIGLSLELALTDLASDSGRAVLERAIDQLHGVVRDMRSYIFDLRPRHFDGDLPLALRELANEFERNSLIRTVAIVPEDVPKVRIEQSIAIYHIAHEALSNIRKHADAGLVSLSLVARQGYLVLEVRDDGRGFPVDRDLPEKHRGLRNMANRATAIGARIDVQSAGGLGTTIKVEVPLLEAVAAEVA